MMEKGKRGEKGEIIQNTAVEVTHMNEERLSFGEKYLLATHLGQNISRAFRFYFILKIRLKRR